MARRNSRIEKIMVLACVDYSVSVKIRNEKFKN